MSPGVMAYSLPLADSTLYIFTSDAAKDDGIDVRDKTTGARVTFRLQAGHAALVLIGKKEKAVINSTVPLDLKLPKGARLQ